MKIFFPLIVIILFGFLLRVIFISTSPPSLYGDELTITLDAYSLLKTGHDQLGNFMPLTFLMGAGRPAGYVYGSIPFMAIFGPTALGVRVLSILSGIGIIILLYLIGKRVFSERVGILAALIGAVSPWDISLSRGGFEAHFALFLVLVGIYLFILGKQKPIFYIFSAFAFGLTLHTYPTYKVSLLLFLPLLVWYEGGVKEVIKKRYLLLGFAVLAIFGVLALSQTIIGGSEARFSNINIFSQNKLKASIEQKINFERKMSNLPDTITKYFHNKPVEYSKILIENYLQNFSLDFLIIHGDRNPRHNMATMGQVYFAQLILIIVGFVSFWQKQKRALMFLVAWLLIAPIPTAIIDLPHALRSAFMLPPLVIFSALGLMTILNSKNERSSSMNKIILSVVLLFFFIQFGFFVQKLYFLAPNEYSNFWSYPAKLASETAILNKKKYNFIILSDKIDNIEFAYPVYDKTDPASVISQNKEKTFLDNYSFKKIDNIYIGYLPETGIEAFLNNLEGSALYIGSIGEAKSLTNYQTRNALDGTPAFILKEK